MRGVVGLLLAACLLGMPACGGNGDETPTIVAATSLRRVLPALIEAHGGTGFDVSYAGSGTLRRQVEAGAPCALAIFASPLHADRLVEQGHADGTSRAVIASNTLVLIGPQGSAPRTFASLKDVPEDFRIAIGTPESVPAGHYAQEAFTNLGIWSDVKPRCIQAEDVAAVLTYVRRGEVDVGVAYGSELVGIDGVASLEVASGDWAPHPLVVAVAVKDGPHPKAAAAFLTFLQSKEARAIFDRFGFGAP